MEGWGKKTTYLINNRKLKKASRKLNKDNKQKQLENLIKIFKLYFSIHT